MFARVRNSAPGPAPDTNRSPVPPIEARFSLPSPQPRHILRSHTWVEGERTPLIAPPEASRAFAATSAARQVLAADGGDVNSLLGNLRLSLSAVGTTTVGQNHVEEIERCRHLSLFCVISGSGQFRVGDDIIDAAIGTVILVPRDRKVCLQVSPLSGEDFAVSKAHLSIELGQGISFSQTLDRTIVNRADTTFADLNVLQAFDGVLAGSLGAHAIAEALLTVLVIRTLCVALADAGSDGRMQLSLTHPGIARVLNVIASNPGLGHSVESLAAIAGLTRHELARLFDAIFQQTPASYLKSVRLKLAESLLLDTRQPVKTIAGIVGYSSRSHFSRTFREHRGVDPTEYRQMHSSSGSR